MQMYFMEYIQCLESYHSTVRDNIFYFDGSFIWNQIFAQYNMIFVNGRLQKRELPGKYPALTQQRIHLFQNS